MKRIKLEITSLSPLAIAARKPGSVSEAEDHIPGSVIRGAIASHILQLSNLQLSNQQTPRIAEQNFTTNGGDFEALFLGDEPAIFQNAYPAVAKMVDESNFTKKKSDLISQVVTDEVMVLPATAVSSKTNAGFKPKGNGVFDTLIDRFCADAYNFPYDPSDPKSLEEKTDARVEPFGGFYSKTNEKIKYKYRSHSISTRFLTRVGINRRRATSEDDILYSIEVLNESFLENPQAGFKNWRPVVYRSSILVKNAELAKSLENFINQNSHFFRLGGATSRGLGKVIIKAEIEDASADVEARITEFEKKLQQRWKLWSVFGKPEKNLLENRTYFTLDLQADAILTENWRRTTVISPQMLCQAVELNDDFSQLSKEEQEDFLKLEVAYSSYNYRSGWNSAWGLMKDIELVTNRGAVYLFSTNKRDLWMDKLKELEFKGIGDRTSEGFGSVQICNPFHLIMREEAV